MHPEDEKTLTIARRTKKNLDFMYLKKLEGEDVEEFTQLLNSTYGILICLREDFIKGDNVKWDEIVELGLVDETKEFKKIIGVNPTHQSPKLKLITTFSGLITNLRNSFAHNCFELTIDSKTNEITGLTVWNIPVNAKNILENRIWQENLSENQLKDILYLVLSYVERVLVGS